MWSVYKKEFRQFFSSLTGYVAIIIFLLLTGLLLFVFQDTSILEFGYASLSKFFDISPWILLLLIPAITMRSFSDEFRLGTYEILRTKPISSWHLVTGKYAAILAVVLIALIPTLVYCYCIQQLAAQNGLDSGATLGSYIGLFFLSAVFSAIGVWCSSFTNNAVVSFLAAALACLLIYSGFAAISRLPALASGGDYFLEMMGIDFHFRSISRGVVDSRDIVYFLSVIYFFLFLCKRNLDKR